jgi:hypothetical protein
MKSCTETGPMSQVGKIPLRSGCGDWSPWIPRDRRRPAYHCDVCARSIERTCSGGPDEGTRSMGRSTTYPNQ